VAKAQKVEYRIQNTGDRKQETEIRKSKKHRET
jgi:hypothetical protein